MAMPALTPALARPRAQIHFEKSSGVYLGKVHAPGAANAGRRSGASGSRPPRGIVRPGMPSGVPGGANGAQMMGGMGMGVCHPSMMTGSSIPQAAAGGAGSNHMIGGGSGASGRCGRGGVGGGYRGGGAAVGGSVVPHGGGGIAMGGSTIVRGDMSNDQRGQIFERMSKLGSKDYIKACKIIEESMPSLAPDINGEIEVDINDLGSSMLWHLWDFLEKCMQAPKQRGSAAAALISSIDVAWKRNQHQLRSVRAARSSLGGSADSGVADGRSAARASKASPAAAASSSALGCSGGDADGADGGLMSDGDSDGGGGGGGADGHWNEERDEYAMGGF
jgi:hypothetical protein